METNPKTSKTGLALHCEPRVRRTGILPVSNREAALRGLVKLETGGTPVLRHAPDLLPRLSVRRVNGLKFVNCCKSTPRWVRQS